MVCPTLLPTVRAACLANVSTMPWRRLVPQSRSLIMPPRSAAFSASASGGRDSSAFSEVRRPRISYADSRFTGVSYRAPTGLRAMTAARSSGVIAPIRQRGGQISVRSTGIGTPFSCKVETSASPTPSCEITPATSSFGLATKVSAAVFTAFWSRGVYARSAC